jgi:ABC-type oligopeptide transport system substrate-binding subunit
MPFYMGRRSWPMQRILIVTCCLMAVLMIGILSTTVIGYSPVVNSLGKVLPPDAAPLEKQIFRFMAGEPQSLDISIDLYHAEASEFMFERLLLRDQNNDLVPGAADTWQVSEDGLTWTFNLRPGNRWTDGRPVTAHDFEYTFHRLLNPASGNRLAFLYYDITGAQDFTSVKTSTTEKIGVRAIDDLTLEITTDRACPYLPHIVAFQGSSPVPRWQVEKYGKRWTEQSNIVSNASYRMTEWATGQFMKFELNPMYSGPNMGSVEQIVEFFSSPRLADLMAYENNEIDLAAVPPQDMDRIRRDPVLSQELVTFSYHDTRYLIFRTQKPPFDDLRVRQAFALAIDRDALCNVVLKGMHKPASGMIEPGYYPGLDLYDNTPYQQYNPEKARRLLTDAGYPDGKGFPTIPLALATNTSSMAALEIEAIQQMLQETLNISIKIEIIENRVWTDRMYQYDLPLSYMTWWRDFPDPNNQLGAPWRTRAKGLGRQDWISPSFNTLIDEAAYEQDPKKRMQMYADAQRILSREAGGIFIRHRYGHQLRKPWIKGIGVDRKGYFPYNGHGTKVVYDVYVGE